VVLSSVTECATVKAGSGHCNTFRPTVFNTVLTVTLVAVFQNLNSHMLIDLYLVHFYSGNK